MDLPVAALSPLRAYTALEQWLTRPIDARVYALVRICYAVLCLAIVVDLWPARAELFSETGMLDLQPGLPWYYPLVWVRSELGVGALLAAVAIASVCLGLGLFTRVCALFLCAWNVAYSTVGYPAESGYDAIARVVGLALLVAPPVRAWALDRFVFGNGEAQISRHSLRLLQWQLFIVYIATVWLKAPDNYWRNGELLAYFMMSIYSRFPSPVWASFGRASALFTWGTLLIESSVVFLLWSPRLRKWGLLLGLALHGTIGALSTVTMFSLAMVPLYAAFLEDQDLVDLKLVRA